MLHIEGGEEGRRTAGAKTDREEDDGQQDNRSRTTRISRRPFHTGFIRPPSLRLYPYLEDEDITQALTYAAWRTEEIELPLVPA